METLRRLVTDGRLPGAVALVAVDDDAEVFVVGNRAYGGPPMTADTLFRIASMTKPITAAVTLQLVDDGVFALEDSVAELLPELADRPVLRAWDGPLDDTVPAERDITIDDLLTFRLGFGAVMAEDGATPIQRAEAALDVKSLTRPWPPTPHDADEWIAAFATLPLMEQPGTTWRYNTGSQILGVLLGRASGLDLDALFRQRIFEPLGMDDTGFVAGDVDRLAVSYLIDDATGEKAVIDPAGAGSDFAALPRFRDGSSGLVSTVGDYWRFVRHVRDELEARMVVDRLTPDQRRVNEAFFGETGSWGHGLRVPAADLPGEPWPGGYGWAGGRGTNWTTRRLDDGRTVTGILMTHRAMDSPEPAPAFAALFDEMARRVAVDR